MSQNRQWISLDEPVNFYLDESEQSNQKFYKIWNFAYRWLHDVGLDAFFIVKSVKIPTNENLTATLPADFLNYSKVGVLNEKGEVITMGVNNNLTVSFDLSPNRIQQVEDPTMVTIENQQGSWWYNYWNGYGYGNLYGLPSGQPFIGNYKIDNANGVIVLSPGFSYPYIILEYVCTPTPGQEYYFPIQFREAVIAYLRWMDIISIPAKTHVHNSNVIMRRKDYFNELRKAKAKYDPVRIPDLYEWNLLNQRLTVKA